MKQFKKMCIKFLWFWIFNDLEKINVLKKKIYSVNFKDIWIYTCQHKLQCQNIEVNDSALNFVEICELC